jgi:hypothetical protein
MATRTQRTARPTGGRFARPAGTPAKRPAARRSATPSRRPTIVTRRKPKKTGMAKVLDGVAGALPGGGAKKGASGGGKGRTAGLAVLAGAAGLALKNRDKLTGMMRSKGSGTGDRTSHADAPANPIVVTEGPAAKDATAPPPTTT